MWFTFILGSIFMPPCFKLIIIHYYTPEQAEIKFKPRIKLNHNMSILSKAVCLQFKCRMLKEFIGLILLLSEWILFLCKYYSKILVWTRNMWTTEPCEDWGGGGGRGGRRNETTCVTRGERIKNWTCKCNQRNLAGWRKFEPTILTGIGLGISGYCCAGWWNCFG